MWDEKGREGGDMKGDGMRPERSERVSEEGRESGTRRKRSCKRRGRHEAEEGQGGGE